jgi:hypothetical protein
MRQFIGRLRAYPEHLRFKWYPKIARVCLNLATYQARQSLKGVPPLVLVDNTVLDAAVTHETRWISTGTKEWGNQQINTGYSARVPVHSAANQSDRYKQITYLTSIAHMARLGALKLHLSAELEDEQFRQPGGRFRGYSYCDYSLFSDIELESIDGWTCATMGPSWMGLPSVAEQQRRRLRQSDDQLFHDLFALLKEQLGQKCDQDAWHIRTAERHRMLCFLTMDGPLLKACQSLRKKEPLRSMTTQIMSPEELGKHLGLVPIHPHLLSYNDASWFVRNDYTMPGERRRRRGEYKSN